MAGINAAINTGNVGRGDSVAVLGCGGIDDAVIVGSHLAGAASSRPLPQGRRYPRSAGRSSDPLRRGISVSRTSEAPRRVRRFVVLRE
ncbi:hypothetical protein GCM10022232_18030 [Streptomyces plumbiresistens]|uniref:Uncharacterized protein n=1 Tax=Streptomyces plumbiresistens TaxID=511811 RepID=A0ABP7QNV0_9ACTN